MACFEESPLGVFHLTGRNAIPQGADWQFSIAYKNSDGTPVDFTGFSAVMQVRRDYDKEIILELSTANGTIVLSSGAADTPNVVINFPHATTSAMSEYDGIYDLEVTSVSGTVYKFIEGNFELRREITK